MIFSMTYKNVESHDAMEAGAVPHVAKLEKLLKSYSQDAVQLHGVLAKSVKKEEYLLTLNLTIPTGKLHCVGNGGHIRNTLKTAFSELEGQIKKHKEHLRHDHEWKRKRPRRQQPGIPAENES
jgi:ribosome-associated translation inhibitor RaiA